MRRSAAQYAESGLLDGQALGRHPAQVRCDSVLSGRPQGRANGINFGAVAQKRVEMPASPTRWGALWLSRRDGTLHATGP